MLFPKPGFRCNSILFLIVWPNFKVMNNVTEKKKRILHLYPDIHKRTAKIQ